MKILEWIDKNMFAILWFLNGLLFFVLGTIAAVNNQTDRSIACIAVCLACHARCEINILQRRVDK